MGATEFGVGRVKEMVADNADRGAFSCVELERINGLTSDAVWMGAHIGLGNANSGERGCILVFHAQFFL